MLDMQILQKLLFNLAGTSAPGRALAAKSEYLQEMKYVSGNKMNIIL